jgi:DUF917 family protein/N-methylhydantoinase A/oxoprolinase/acetone carboxylase beta subunit
MEKTKYIYSEEQLYNDWTEGEKIQLDGERFINKLQELFENLWIIENKFDPEQKTYQEESFKKYSKGSETIDRGDFNTYYSEVLASLLRIHYVIGIDVGGTNTDAVILEMPEIKVISWTKVPTTSDIKTGVFNSLVSVFEKQTVVVKEDIKGVFIGTTAFVNAVIQRSDYLSKVSVFRICGLSTTGLPPFVDFPDDLRKKIQQKEYFLSGGMHYSGSPSHCEFRLSEVEEKAHELIKHLKAEGLSEVHVAVVGVFSPVNDEQEVKTKQKLEEVFTANGISHTVTISSKVGEFGLLERENATILNASLKSYARRTVNSFRRSLVDFGFKNNFYFTQNDGTVADSEFIAENPAHTFSTGPVNSLRGASFLTRLKNCIVADIGGTTCDLAAMIGGFARESSTFIEIGGVRTNFKMPNVQSIGLGGGSMVDITDTKVKVGPTSVGYRLFTEGVSFGGQILTATDIALKAGHCEIECSNRDLVNLTPEQVKSVQAEINRLLQVNIDSMKTSSEACPLVLVGGGSVIIQRDTQFEGISEIILPKYFDVANAIGAAICKVSGWIDDIYSDVEKCSRDEYELKVRKKAISKAVSKGSILELTSITQMDKIDLAYMPGNKCRMKAKAVGCMNLSALNEDIKIGSVKDTSELETNDKKIDPKVVKEASHTSFNFTFSNPKVVLNTESGRHEWIVSEEDLEYIALGASILGTGGGGCPYQAFLGARELLRQGKVIRIISPDDLKDDELVTPVAFFGAPLCIIEKLYNFQEIFNASEPLFKFYNGEKKVTACMPCEIGGLNSLTPLWYGAIKGLPVVDTDLMGRAFPRIDLTITAMHGLQNPPIGLGDDSGNQIVVFNSYKNDMLVIENIMRKTCDVMSLVAGISFDPLDKKLIKNYGVNYTLSRAWRFGRAIIENRKQHLPLMDALNRVENVGRIIDGKITYLDRRIEGGYNMGVIDIEGIGDYTGYFMTIKFQNENLIALKRTTRDGRGTGEVVAVTPDLITILDINTFDAILCEDLRYGIRVAVITLPCHPLLRSDVCLPKAGPLGFGYINVEYTPFADYTERDSLIKEFQKS